MIPPDSFFLGPIKIYYYSLCLLAAVWAGYWVAIKQARRHGLKNDQLTDTVLIVLVAGVIGARLGFVLQNWPDFSHHFDAIFRLTTGGLSIHGAIISGGLGLYLYARQQKINFLSLTDSLALPLLVGQIIGRLGNYFNQELFGYPTNLPWAIHIDLAHRPTDYSKFLTFQPTFLYEMLFNLIGLAILSRLRCQKAGQLTGAYLIVFAVSRFLTEVWRISDRTILELSLAQLVSLFVLGLGWWLWLRRQIGRPF